MRKYYSLAVAAFIASTAFADNDSNEIISNENNAIISNENSVATNESDFQSDECTEEGFITHYLNEAIASGMQKADNATEVEYGRKVTDYVSAPKFGGYFIGKYDYNDQDGTTKNGGFSQRLIRFYVDGKILNDFAYRIQIQTNNDKFHMKDFFLEWQKYAEFKVKIGQYKRAFGFENPMNPWDISSGDYSLFTKVMTSDSRGESSWGGGRDQGIQVQGDLFPMGKDNHRLVHYQVMVANGEGINVSDNDKRKDVIGTIQLQPIKNLFIGFFGWTGSSNKSAVTEKHNRYSLGVKYEENGWTARGEYGHSQSNVGNDDVWYVLGAMPVNDWFRVGAQYQCYRKDKAWSNAQNVYSIIPEIQLHKNLKFQLQYNFVNDKNSTTDKHYNELWFETYVRF